MNPRWSLLLALGATSACGPRPGPANAAAGECSVQLGAPPPALPAPPAVVAPSSRIAVDISAAVGTVKRELSKNVPVQLARARNQPIGTPGEVSYTVSRGSFDIGLARDRLVVATPISVEAQVCKPLGPICPIYGRCSPRLAAVASVPLTLGDDYELGHSRVSVSMTRGCVIAGFDASDEIRKNAAQQVGGVQRRIDASVPKLRPYVEGTWRLLQTPVALSGTTCLRIAPGALVQKKPTLASGTLGLRFGVLGTLSVEEPCNADAAPAATLPLPKLRVDDDLPAGVSLQVPLRISWADASADLTRSLTSTAARTAHVHVVKARAIGVMVGTAPRVLLTTTVSGTLCGDAYLLAEPWYDAAASRVRLRQVVLAPGTDLEASDVAELTALVEQHATVALPLDAASAPNALQALVERLAEDLPEPVRAEVALEPARVEPVLLDGESLVPIISLTGKATVRVQ
jgi:hypothetical protein